MSKLIIYIAHIDGAYPIVFIFTKNDEHLYSGINIAKVIRRRKA